MQSHNESSLVWDVYGSAIMETITDGFYDGTVKACIQAGVFSSAVENSSTIKFGFKMTDPALQTNSIVWSGKGIDEVQWMYVDEHGAPHSGQLYHMQSASEESHQFCQTYALHLALFPKARAQLSGKSKRLAHISQVAADIWAPYLKSSRQGWLNLRKHIQKMKSKLAGSSSATVANPISVDHFIKVVTNWAAVAYFDTW